MGGPHELPGRTGAKRALRFDMPTLRQSQGPGCSPEPLPIGPLIFPAWGPSVHPTRPRQEGGFLLALTDLVSSSNKPVPR